MTIGGGFSFLRRLCGRSLTVPSSSVGGGGSAGVDSLSEVEDDEREGSIGSSGMTKPSLSRRGWWGCSIGVAVLSRVAVPSFRGVSLRV